MWKLGCKKSGTVRDVDNQGGLQGGGRTIRVSQGGRRAQEEGIHMEDLGWVRGQERCGPADRGP